MIGSWRIGPLEMMALTGALGLAALGACSDDETETTDPTTTTTQGPGPGGGGSAGTGGSGAAGGAGGNGGSCANMLPSEVSAPPLLSATGLYSDIGTKTLAPYVREFTPQYPLWSDGAVKTRWIYLPECNGPIDNTDQDVWDFPVGTRMWKQFEVSSQLMETRMIHRHGAGPKDFVFAAYQWRADDSDADHVPSGFEDVKGTEHDIPDEVQCERCHGGTPLRGGTPSRYLGFDAIQLSHSGAGVNMASLSADGLLTSPAPNGFTIPGTTVEQAALGIFHDNCGNCHNDTADGIVNVMFNMRAKTGDTNVAMTGVYTGVVNQLTTLFQGQGCNYRVAGLDVADSCVHFRMSERGTDMTPNAAQMPPFGTDVVDATGLAAVEAWIGTLPAP
jgi:hypothetical protein